MLPRAWRTLTACLLLGAGGAVPSWPARDRVELALAALLARGTPGAAPAPRPAAWPPAARWLAGRRRWLPGGIPLVAADRIRLLLGAGRAEGLRCGDLLAVPGPGGPCFVGEVVAVERHRARARTLYHRRSWWLGRTPTAGRLALVGDGAAVRVAVPERPERLAPGLLVVADDPERPGARGLALARLAGAGDRAAGIVDPAALVRVGVWRGGWVRIPEAAAAGGWRRARVLVPRDGDPLRDSFLLRAEGPVAADAPVAAGERFLGWVRRAAGGLARVRGVGDPGFRARAFLFRGEACRGVGVFRGAGRGRGVWRGPAPRAGDVLVLAPQGAPAAVGLVLGRVKRRLAGGLILLGAAPRLRGGAGVWVGPPREV